MSGVSTYFIQGKVVMFFISLCFNSVLLNLSSVLRLSTCKTLTVSHPCVANLLRAQTMNSVVVLLNYWAPWLR